MPLAKEDIIQDIQKCYERHGAVNGRLMNREEDLVCKKTLYNYFGGVEEAINEAGFEIHHSQDADKITVECQSCGETQEQYPYRIKQRGYKNIENCKFCMEKKKQVECSICEEPIIRHRYRIQDPEINNFFCSQECENQWRSENFKGENHPRWNPDKKDYFYGTEWPDKREERIEIDDGKCVSCEMTREEHYDEFGRDIQVHHIEKLSKYIESDDLTREEAHRMENLKTMCIVCHRKEEKNYE